MRHRLLAYGWLWMFFLLLASYNWSFGTQSAWTNQWWEVSLLGMLLLPEAADAWASAVWAQRPSERPAAPSSPCPAYAAWCGLWRVHHAVGFAVLCSCCLFLMFFCMFWLLMFINVHYVMKLRSRRCLQGRDCSSEDEQCTLRGGTRKSSLQLLVINMMILMIILLVISSSY